MDTVQNVLQTETLKSPAIPRPHRDKDFKRLLHHTGRDKQKGPSNTRKMCGFTSLSQLAFYVNLHRAVIGPSATLTGRWRPDIDLRRMLTGMHIHKVTSGHFLSIYAFYSIQWLWQRTANALIRMRGCLGCPHMLKDTFSHGAADMTTFCCRSHRFNSLDAG